MDNDHSRPEMWPKSYHKSESLREASGHAWSGLRAAFASERNLKVQVFIWAAVLVLAVILRLSFLEMAMIILISATVVALEMVNTAVEHFADVVEPKYSDVVRRIKDFTAGAVLLVSVAAVVVGLLLFVPPVLLRLIG